MRIRTSVYMIATGLAFIATTVLAQTDTNWTSNDGIWSNPSNWNNGVPIGNFNAIISGNAGEITQDLAGLNIAGLDLNGEFANLILEEETTVGESFNWNGSAISGSQPLIIMGNGTIQNGELNTTINNFGTVEVLQGTIFSPTGIATPPTWNNRVGSTVVLSESALFGNSANQIGTFNNDEGATLHQIEGAASALIWNVANRGTVQIENNAQLLFINDFVQHPSGTLRLMGPNSIADMFGFSQIEGRIEGEGIVISSVELDGVIAPGQPNPADPIGSLEIAGNLLMMPDSVLNFDVGSEADFISVSHNLILDGTINLTAQAGLEPGTYTLITANQQLIAVGVNLGSIPDGVEASLEIDDFNREVNLVVESVDIVILGDVNGDGLVNLLDVDPFVKAISIGIFIPEADVNQDGSVDLLDVPPFIDLLAG